VFEMIPDYARNVIAGFARLGGGPTFHGLH
jgi:acetyl-CoA carboxylase carboxyltransferase component